MQMARLALLLPIVPAWKEQRFKETELRGKEHDGSSVELWC